MGLTIDIAVEHDAWRSVDDLDGLAKQAVNAALAESGAAVASGTELSLVLCDDVVMQNLNRDWRGQDKATNVLSFPADPSARRVTLGDIVVAYQTTAREASNERKTIRDHLIHLIVHGTLHLLGYDHQTDAEAEAMEQFEVRALARLGIASPYELTPPMHESA